MKTIYLFKSLAVIMLIFLVTNVTAKEINVPANGTDTDVAAALEQAETGDVIVISGWITVNAPITVNKNVKFISNGNLAGFDGQGLSKIIELAPEPIEGASLIFEDLGFVGGYNADDGGVGRIVNGTTVFNKCFFEENETAGRGGVFYVAEPETNVKFVDCEGVGNKSGNRGGFIFVAGDATTTYEYCKIQANNSFGGRGGAFYLEGGYHRFFHTILEGNTSGNVAVPGNDEEGGAGITTAGNIKSLTLESSAIVSNVAYGNHGAAFFLMGSPNVTVINTTIANNLTKNGAGSWFIPSSNIDITLVNVTMANNIGTNSGNAGGGIRIMNTGNRINVFNSILIRNTCDNGEGAIDMGLSNNPVIPQNIVFKNSIVGLISGVSDPTFNILDNANIPTKSLINMYSLGGESAQSNYVELDVSGVNFQDGLQRTVDFKMPYFTLKDATVYAAKLGDPALLAAYDVSDDQLLANRTIAADGSIFAGSVQAVVGDQIYVGIKPLTVSQPSENIRILGTVSNGILGVDFGSLVGRAKGELISINGQVVEKVFDLNVIGKGYYNVKTTTPGIYLLKVTLNGKNYTQRLIVK
jgi:hypothetical protein